MGFCLGKWMESAMSAVCHDWSWYGASGNALKDYFGLELDYSVLCMSIMVQFIFFFSLIPGKLDFMTAQFLSSTFEERSLRRRWLHISHYKKKTENWGEKTCLKKKKKKLMNWWPHCPKMTPYLNKWSSMIIFYKNVPSWIKYE